MTLGPTWRSVVGSSKSQGLFHECQGTLFLRSSDLCLSVVGFFLKKASEPRGGFLGILCCRAVSPQMRFSLQHGASEVLSSNFPSSARDGGNTGALIIRIGFWGP